MNVLQGKLKVVLLVGGLGTRLRSVVPSTAKPMATIGDTPFLEIVLKQLISQGFSQIVLCTGYRAADIEDRLGHGARWNINIEYSREMSPLGTAGAVKFAEALIRDDNPFIVMNGDSFLELDLHNLLRKHHACGGIATMATVPVADRSRYGSVVVDSNERVVGFEEKSSVNSSAGLANGGVYVFAPQVFDFIPKGPASLEKDVFPAILDKGVFALRGNGLFIDIGTPADYTLAQKLATRLHSAAAGGFDGNTLPDADSGSYLI